MVKDATDVFCAAEVKDGYRTDVEPLLRAVWSAYLEQYPKTAPKVSVPSDKGSGEAAWTPHVEDGEDT
eukprot:2394871-Rhodomonas_salina.1